MAVTRSTGDGFALYNGLRSPDIYSVYTPELQSEYPYAVLFNRPDYDSFTTLIISKNPCYITYSHIIFNIGNNNLKWDDAGCLEFQDLVFHGEGVSLGGGQANLDDVGAVWTNHDIYYADDYTSIYDIDGVSYSDPLAGTLYLAASAPIPLDGMEVIEWDGDTTGLEETGTAYKIAEFPSMVGTPVFTIHNWDGTTMLVPNDGDRNGYLDMSEDGLSSFYLLYDGAPIGVGYSSPVPEEGINAGFYLTKAQTNDEVLYVNLFAYPASTEPEDGGGHDWFWIGYMLGRIARNTRLNYPTLAASSTWYKGAASRSTITEINMVNNYTPTGNETESWAADVDGTGEIMCYITGTVLTMAVNGSGKIMANDDASKMFEGFASLTSIVGLRLLDTTNTTNFARMFYSCTALEYADVSAFNTVNATTLERMFFDCRSLLVLDVSNFSTVNVTNMDHTFYRCAKLTELDVSGFRTENVTTMNRMFFECNAVVNLDVSNFNTANVTNMDHMFARCNVLISLDLSSFDTANVTTFWYIFEHCYALTVIYVGDGWDTSNATETSGMFYQCGVSEVTYV